MQMHAACPPGGRAGVAASSAEQCGGPTPTPIATADLISRQVARAAGNPIPPAAQPFPHARPSLGNAASARGTFPGRPPQGAAGGFSSPMTTVRFIRVFVFRMSQQQFAAVLGTSQGRVSTWETSGRWPSVVVMDLVRLHGIAICAERGEAWNDSWFFEVPVSTGAALPAAAE